MKKCVGGGGGGAIFEPKTLSMYGLTLFPIME